MQSLFTEDKGINVTGTQWDEEQVVRSITEITWLSDLYSQGVSSPMPWDSGSAGTSSFSFTAKAKRHIYFNVLCFRQLILVKLQHSSRARCFVYWFFSIAFKNPQPWYDFKKDTVGIQKRSYWYPIVFLNMLRKHSILHIHKFRRLFFYL